ncbi:uncharacterized protein N7479_007859 [Penicillium vulpinum]|uniref:uncharacterized protein n=1 Tax=Penicillium vulpinum TaxID=29845 RepID=UPI00254760CF|nr:uncharacterized protein N7479_007859 [Penicillium vulpinum]KAJ5960709.1 hypothetical protein N7479_007859 [Penicillium vulpinum]
MSGVEVIAVVACVAAIVSAYGDGAQLFSSIRKKYHERQFTKELERSLALGHTEIRSQYDQHHRELGRPYETGDAIAREQMKDIIITLQGALLWHLREAQEQGTTLDLRALQIESDRGRVRTLVILRELYQRLSIPPPVPPTISMSIDPNYVRVDAFGRGQFPNHPDRYLPFHSSETGYHTTRYPVSSGSYQTGRFLSDAMSASPTDTQGPSRDEPTHIRPSRRRSSGFGSVVSSVGDLFHSRPGRGSTPPFPTSAPEPGYVRQTRVYTQVSPSTSEPIPGFDVRPATPPHKLKEQSNLILHDVDSGNVWGDSDSDSVISHNPAHKEVNHLSLITTPPEPRKYSLSAPSIGSADSIRSDPSTRSSTDRPAQLTQATRPLWPPSEENNYLGFCKGAWKVHTGFKAFKVYTEPGTGYFTQQSWLRCGKCAFEAPMSPRSTSRKPQFDQTVRTHQASGVRYRFEFLAKSHVRCKRDSALRFSPNTPRGAFCCVFCCAMAQGSTQVYGTLDTFMAHLAEEHWSVDKAPLAVLSSMRCVVGRMAPDSEYFDVNILPRVVS